MGISIPSNITEKLAELTEVLKPLVPGKRWYEREQLHITTNFLGELDRAAADNAMQLLSETVPKHHVFTLSLSAPGAFPHAKVVWCGVGGETGKLQALQLDLRQSLSELGAERYERDRYIPHITLARTERLGEIQANLQAAQEAAKRILQDASWKVYSICLFESVSGSGGPQYPVRHEVKLAHDK